MKIDYSNYSPIGIEDKIRDLSATLEIILKNIEKGMREIEDTQRYVEGGLTRYRCYSTLLLKYKILKKIGGEGMKKHYELISLKNLSTLITKEFSMRERVANSLTICRDDSIYLKKMEGNKLSIKIYNNQDKDERGTYREVFDINFEDEDTLDYFIEKIKNVFDKMRWKLGKKADRIRFKILQINKSLIPLETKAKQINI